MKSSTRYILRSIIPLGLLILLSLFGRISNIESILGAILLTLHTGFLTLFDVIDTVNEVVRETK